MELINQNIKQIRALCAKHSVEVLSVFGSMASGAATADSDVDLLVTFGEVVVEQYADNYYDLTVSLENLLGRKVDLITEKTITNPYLLNSINRNKVSIYERGNPSLAA